MMLSRRRMLMESLVCAPLVLVGDGVIHHGFDFTKSGVSAEYGTANGKILLQTYDNSTSSYSRVVAVSQEAFDLSRYRTLKVAFNYTNNTYGASVFHIGVGAEDGSFDEYVADERRTAAVNGVEIMLDIGDISGSKHIILYNSTVQASAQQGSKYTITKIWLE